MPWRLIRSIVLFVVFMPALAAAQTEDAPFSHVGLVVKFGSLGVGIGAATPVLPRVNLRVDFNFLSLSHTFDTDGISLDATLKARSVEAKVDWFPMGGRFHVSPGVMLYNGNEVDASASVSGGKQFSLSGQDLVSNPANPVTGSFGVTFQRVAPSISIGWGNVLPKRGGRRWSIPVEIGLIYTREPTVALALSGSACATNGTNCRNIATDAGLQADVAKQQSDINHDIRFLKIYPVSSIGFSYRF